MNTKNYLTHTKKYKQIISAVHMVYRLVNSTYNANELILRLTRLICQFIQANSCSVYILDAASKELSVVGVFDNKINILLQKKNDFSQISDRELNVTKGYPIFEGHLLAVPLIADDNLGAIIVKRKKTDPSFSEFDKDMLSVVAEQSVTAIKSLQFFEEQQKVVLGSIEFIGKLLKQHGYVSTASQASVSFRICRELGESLKITKEEIDSLYYACMLREAGVIDVPYDVLYKKSQLSPEDFKAIKNQPARAAELIKPVAFLKPVLPIILYHHERYDGLGYPSGLKRDQIPICACIISIVGAFEAMVKGRPYKKKLSIDEAVVEIQLNSGTQFHPTVVDKFVSLSKKRKFRNCLRLTIK